MFLVDTFGKRTFFLEAGFEMICCMVLCYCPWSQITIARLTTAHLFAYWTFWFADCCGCGFGSGVWTWQRTIKRNQSLSCHSYFLIRFGICKTWGPLGWLIPSELFPLEIQSATQSVVVCVNEIFTALLAQLFLMSLCHLKYGIFLLFAGLIIAMSGFVFFILPETKHVPIEEIYLLFENHWFWKKIGQRDPETSNVKPEAV